MKVDKGFSRRLIELAGERGAPEAEVYQNSSRLITADSRSGSAESVVTSNVYGYCIRIINDGRLGFSYSTDFSEYEAVVDTAIRMSKNVDREEFLDIPSPIEHKTPPVYDTTIASFGEEDAIDFACQIEKAAYDEDSRIKRIRKASASFLVSEMHVMNSNNLSFGYSSTTASAQITAVADDGFDNQMGWDFQSARFISDISFEGLGVTAARNAIALLGARRISSVKSRIILDARVAASFLSIFTAMLSAEAVQKGRSLLQGKIGEMITSPVIDIIDDGLMPHGPGTRHIDDEGVPTQTKCLIREGILQGFMHNTLTARKDGIEPTGNAVKGGLSILPAARPLNLYLTTSGDKMKRDDMLKEMKRGLYVLETMGMHTASPISGDFSVGITGLWVEGGEVRYPVKEAVMSGNILDFLKSVEFVGDNLRFYGNIGSPDLMFGPTDLSA